ncbi:MAG: type II toxin-antitoxin system HicA family toxin [Planctomycetota bacterium]
MTKEDKRFARLATNPKNVKFRDFVAVIESCGFVLAKQTGSHRRYKHPAVRDRHLVIQPRGGMAKPYQVGQFLEMVAEYHLRDE